MKHHRVLLVDDDDFTRMTLRAVLASLDYDVIGDAANVVAAMDLARAERPDLAVIDLDLGEGPTGIDLAHGLRTLVPSIGLVMLSSYADPRLIGRRTRPLPNGTQYLSKQSVGDASVLRAALHTSLDRDGTGVPAEGTALTDAQIEMMRLIATGYSNAEIAKRMWITEDGVNRAVTRLVKQLGLQVTKERNTRVLISRAYADLAGRAVPGE
jgi:two-component system, NarL family, nitrate/nitrite response regulator NarL